MRALSVALISVSTLAIAACSSGSNVAPVVYGTQPASGDNTRIYNSPNDFYAKNAAYGRSASRVAVVTPAHTNPKIDNAYGRPAPLTPVTQTTYDEPHRAEVYRPVYIADTQPQPLQEPSEPRISAAIVTVEAGDTVYAISRRTGATPQSIIALNRLKPPYALEIGDRLRVPVTRGAGEATNTAAIRRNEPVRQVVSRNKMHTVRPGETLYGVSRATGVSVDAIAQANQLPAPYQLTVGQQLLIPNAKMSAQSADAVAPPADDVGKLAREISYTQPTTSTASTSNRMFEWPVKGAIIGKYGMTASGKRNDGVNIAAPVGTPIRAAADGEVVYRGSELEGYGNLLLIKHDDGYVTAYAHNDVMLVRKGQKVNQGQVIGKVGQSGSASEPQLHFEIRQNLKSIDPLAFLGS